METVRLFSEAVEEVEYITEDKENGGKNYKIRGIFLQADVKNRNGRIYPLEVLEREVNKYNKNFIEQKRAYGELGHPDGPTVNLERVSHLTESLEQDGKNFIGEAKIMKTPMGEIVKSLMDEGCKLGVSSRGMGSLQQKGGANYVKDDFYLATAADIVADPSAPAAFVNGIMEGKEWVWDNGILDERHVARIEKQMKITSQKQLDEVQLKAFDQFMSSL